MSDILKQAFEGTEAEIRDRARQIRHYLVIQREAVGVRGHEDVDRQYPIPPPLQIPRLSSHEGSP